MRLSSFVAGIAASLLILYMIIAPWCDAMKAPWQLRFALIIISSGLCGWYVPALIDWYRDKR